MKKQRRDSAIKNCEIALRAGQYREASFTMAQYEAGRVFPRGLWSGPGGAVAHWKNYDTKRDEIILNYVFTRTPKLAIKRGWDKLPDVRFVAGMAHLFGNPKEAQKDCEESIRDGANSFLTHAMFLNEMDEFRSIGVFKYVKVSTCNDKNVCDPCNKLAKSKHLIDKMPELPYENCKEEHGCRCWIGVEI